jgi:hypothetical protein
VHKKGGNLPRAPSLFDKAFFMRGYGAIIGAAYLRAYQGPNASFPTRFASHYREFVIFCKGIFND